MTNRKTKTAKHIGGKSFSFAVDMRPNKPLPKKERRDIKAEEFEKLYKKFYGENYLDSFYNEVFQNALKYFKKFSRKERAIFNEEVKRFSKELSPAIKKKVKFYDFLIEIKLNEGLENQIKHYSFGKQTDSENFDHSKNKISSDESYSEGTPTQVTLTKYERNPLARRKCIEYYGTNCFICSFDFETFYGTVGKDFIHVHHLTQIASIGANYKIDPIEDLRPICPNCHSIIHRRKIPYTPEEMKTMLKKAKNYANKGL